MNGTDRETHARCPHPTRNPRNKTLRIADLILPVFAVIVTGWIVGWAGYLPRALSGALVHFAYNVAMPALLIVTIAREPGRSLMTGVSFFVGT